MFLKSGKNLLRDLLVGDSTDTLYYGGVGLNNTSVVTTDTGLIGGGTTVDAFDATTGWNIADDAITPTTNTTTGEYKEGTGCMDVGATYSAGVATYYKTETSFDATGGFVVMWIYIDDKSELTDTTDCIKITLGTGGYTNTDYWNFDYDNLVDGWNSLICKIGDSSGTTGTGVDVSDIDSVKIQFKDNTTIGSGNIRFDYLRYYEPDTMGVTDSKKATVITTGDRYIKTEYTLYSTESNGLSLYEYGDSTVNGTLVTRSTFTEIDKTQSYEMRVVGYLYFEN